MADSTYAELISHLETPKVVVENELGPLLKGNNLEDLTLENLRELVAEYLQNTFSDLKDDLNEV